MTPHVVFDAGNVSFGHSDSVEDCNQAVGRAFAGVVNAADARSWHDGIHRDSLDVLNRLTACAVSENRDGLF